MTNVTEKLTPTPGGYREFVAIAYPLIISNLSITMIHFVDRLFLSWSSTEEIAAALPASILMFTLASLFLGISDYTTVLVAQYFGANRTTDIARATWHGIYISLVGGVVYFALVPLGWSILNWSDHAPEILELELTYFTLLSLSCPFMLVNKALSGFYAGRGKTKVVMGVNLIANSVNALLDYIFIFGWGWIPAMGIEGAAYGTLLAHMVGTILFVSMFLSPRNNEAYQVWSTWTFRKDILSKLIRYGFPSGMQWFLDVGAFTVFVLLIGQMGMIELAASNIVIGLNMLTFIPMEAFGVATATLIGQHMGRKDVVSAEKSAWTAFKAAEVYMLIFAVIYIVFPEPLMRLFEADAQAGDISFDKVVSYGTTILFFVAMYQISDAMLMTFTGALRGAGDTAFTMWNSIIFSWLIFVPGTYIAVHVIKTDIVGVWIWATGYILVLGVIYLARFKSGVWKTIDIIGEKQPGEFPGTGGEPKS